MDTKMQIVKTIKELNALVDSMLQNNETIGFVPTMGALHEGHISLAKQAKKDCDYCIVSIFVNPTQFNNQQDLEKYPRTLERDAKMLEDNDVDIIFAPSAKEIYPEPDTRQFDFGPIDKVMEGEHRRGHFNGVAQVVSRLFDIVRAHKAYFGEKDFQQLAIVRAMVKQLEIDIEIVAMPIVREKSGLALSSRNERLSEKQRKDAANIYKVLTKSKIDCFDNKSIRKTIEFVAQQINAISTLQVEYFDIVDGNSLQTIENWADSNYIIGCVAVFCGEVRLIDNIVYKNNI